MPLTFRRVTLADRPAMLDICATVWDGDDYLPQIFEAWVAAPEGQFTALETEGRVVALAHLTRLAPGEWWLEGIRVHPDYRGRGLAAALHDYHLNLWKQIGEPGTLRLVTGQPAVIKICERSGFTKALAFNFSEAPLLTDAPPRFTLVTLPEAERAFNLVARAPFYAEQNGLCDLGWRFRALTPAYFAERVTAGRVYRWGDWEAALVTLLPEETDEYYPGLRVQFPAVSPARLASFFTDVRRLAYALGQPRVVYCPPPRPDLLAQLKLIGYAPPWDETEYCFEMRQSTVNAPRIDFSYTIYWTKQARAWDTVRRAAIHTALAPVLAQPGFEPNAYARRYAVSGLDDLHHSGASLLALKKVLEAFSE